IEGTIIGQSNNIKEGLQNVIGELPTNYHFKNSGLIFLTLNERKEATQIQGLNFNKKAGAVFPIKPSVLFLISTYYKNIDISQNGNKITVFGELHQKIQNVFENHFGLTKRGNELIFTFENTEILKRRVE